MGSCCCGRYRQNYDVAEYTVEQPERVRVHSFAEPSSTTIVDAGRGISLTQQYLSASTEAVGESLKDNAGSLEHDALNENGRDIATDINTINSEILERDQPSITPRSVRKTSKDNASVLIVEGSDNTKIGPFWGCITENVLVVRHQGAAPPQTKRTVSVEAKSSGFIIDVPYLEGLGPDSSFMTSFNKVEVKSE